MNTYRYKAHVEAIQWNKMGDSDLVFEGYRDGPDSFRCWKKEEAPYLSLPVGCFVYKRSGMWFRIEPGEYLVKEGDSLMAYPKKLFEDTFEPVISYDI